MLFSFKVISKIKKEKVCYLKNNIIGVKIRRFWKLKKLSSSFYYVAFIYIIQPKKNKFEHVQTCLNKILDMISHKKLKRSHHHIIHSLYKYIIFWVLNVKIYIPQKYVLLLYACHYNPLLIWNRSWLWTADFRPTFPCLVHKLSVILITLDYKPRWKIE